MPATAPAVSVAPATDSTQAVRRLFASRRTGGIILALPGGYLFGYGLVSTIKGVEGAPVTLVLGTVLAGISLSKSARFSKSREEDIISAYQAGKPLPKAVRRRLKKKHFRN